jgi:superfamily II DNA or RNA helicase
MIYPTISDYEKFISEKAFVVKSCGIDIDTDNLNPLLFTFQKDIVRWALAKGRAAIFADCGLGKTIIQLEWANQIRMNTGFDVIIIAPLAVCNQTKSEGKKFGYDVNVCESQNDVRDDMINITNYEKLDKFISSRFGAVVLDESSILKSFNVKYSTTGSLKPNKLF